MEKQYVFFEQVKGQFVRIIKKSWMDSFLTQERELSQLKLKATTPTTWMEINLSNLSKNISVFHRYIRKRTSILAVVKCDAYGHGLIPISKELIRLGISKLGVANPNDATQIRSAKIDTNILLLYPFLEDQISLLVKNNVELTISNLINLRSILNYSQKNQKNEIKIHLSFSIGIDSDGMEYKEFVQYVPILLNSNNIVIEGVCGVLSNDNSSKAGIDLQAVKFKEIVANISKLGIQIKSVHLANSESVDLHPNCLEGIEKIDARIVPYVRLGRWLYGTYIPKSKRIGKLVPMIDLIIARVVQVKRLEANKSVGYFGLYKTKMREYIATIPFGWGSSGILLQNAQIYYKGNVFHQVGIMSANALHFKVTPEIEVGDRVSLVETNANIHSKWRHLEKSTNTFVSQIIMQMGSKIPRAYYYET